MRPETAASWLPSSVSEARARTRSQQAFGLAPYPTTSPRQMTRSTPRRASAASTSTSASRLAWMSLRMAMRIGAAPFRPGAGRGGQERGIRDGSGVTEGGSTPAAAVREQVELEVVEVRELPELAVPGADLVVAERLQPLERELLHREARQHAAQHDRAAHHVRLLAPGAGQVSHEPTCEAVSGAGRVEEGRQR